MEITPLAKFEGNFYHMLKWTARPCLNIKQYSTYLGLLQVWLKNKNHSFSDFVRQALQMYLLLYTLSKVLPTFYG